MTKAERTIQTETITWIPVSERKPDNCRFVLVQVVMTEMLTGKVIPNSTTFETDCLEDEPDGIAECYFGNDSANSRVIAWAEVPKGYTPTKEQP